MSTETIYDQGDVVHETPTIGELKDKLEQAEDKLDIIEKHSVTGLKEVTRDCDICHKTDTLTKAIAVQEGTAEICIHCQGIADDIDKGAIDSPAMFDQRLIGH